MVLAHRVTITTATASTPPLPPSPSAIVYIGGGTGAPGGALVAYNTPAAVTSVAEAVAAFGQGTIVDAAAYIESVTDVTIYGIRYNDSLAGSALTTAIEGAIDAIPRAGVGTNTLPRICAVDPRIARNAAPDGSANALVTRLKGICDPRDIVLILDADVATTNPLAVATTYNTNNGGRSVKVDYGAVDTALKTGLPVSVVDAAYVALQDAQVGIQDYPSNIPVAGIVSGDPELTIGTGSDVATLDAGNVGGVAVARGQYHLFGEVSHTTDATDERRFIGFDRVVRRVDEIIRQLADTYIDRGITTDLESQVAGRLNDVLLLEQGRGLIRSGNATAARPASGADPNTLYFNLALNGVNVLRNVSVRQTATLGG